MSRARAVAALLLAAASLPAATGRLEAQPTEPLPAPTLLARVECRSLEGPCEYRYAVQNPPGAAAPATVLVLLEADEADVTASAGWTVRRDGPPGPIRWESSEGVSAGWSLGGFLLTAPGLPRVALAQLEAGPAVRTAATLVPGPAPDQLGSARDLVEGLREQLPSLAGAGWIAPGPARGLLAGRLRTIVELLDRGQRTEAIRRMRALTDELRRLVPASTIPPGRTPGGRRPGVGGATPVAPEVRDLFAATLGLAFARLGALR